MYIAIIAVRKDSVRVPNKNGKKFGDTTLLENKIKQLKKIKKIDKIIVHSESEEYLKIATKYNVDTYKRDDYYATSDISGSEFQTHLAETIGDTNDYLLYCPCTSPLIKTETINNILDKFENISDKYDSLTTVNINKQFMWLDNKPLNYNLNNIPKSQDLPNIYIINHAIVINKKNNIIKNKSFVGKNPYLYEISDIESLDIDNVLDFDICEYLYNKY